MPLFFFPPFLFQQGLIKSSFIAVPLSSVVVNWPEVFGNLHSEPHGRWLLFTCFLSAKSFCSSLQEHITYNKPFFAFLQQAIFKKDTVSYSFVAWFSFFLKKGSFSWYWMQLKCDCCVLTLFILTGDGHCSFEEIPWEAGVMAYTLESESLASGVWYLALPWQIQTVLKTYFIIGHS